MSSSGRAGRVLAGATATKRLVCSTAAARRPRPQWWSGWTWPGGTVAAPQVNLVEPLLLATRPSALESVQNGLAYLLRNMGVTHEGQIRGSPAPRPPLPAAPPWSLVCGVCMGAFR